MHKPEDYCLNTHSLKDIVVYACALCTHLQWPVSAYNAGIRNFQFYDGVKLRKGGEGRLVCFIFFYICATKIIVLGIYIFCLPLFNPVAKKTVLR